MTTIIALLVLLNVQVGASLIMGIIHHAMVKDTLAALYEKKVREP